MNFDVRPSCPSTRFSLRLLMVICVLSVSAAEPVSAWQTGSQQSLDGTAQSAKDDDQPKKPKDPLIGRKVMTISWKAEFKLGKDLVGMAELGKVYTVDGANGNWYHFRGKHGWMKKDFFIPFERAVSYFTGLVNESPGDKKNYHHRGIAWRERGEYEKALRDINLAIQIDGDEASYYNSRGTVYHRQKKYRKALENYQKALEIKPDDIKFLNNRGIAYRELGEYKKALADFDKAISLAPNYAYAYGSKAWMFATAKDKEFQDGEKSVSLAKTACELTKWKEDDLLGTLAAAYAREGKFEQAKRWLQSAMTINPDQYPEMRLSMKQAFENGKPYTR